MNYEIKSNVSGGILKRNRNLIKDAIQSFEGKDVIIKIEKARKKRSNPQNAYYHSVVIPLVQQGLKDTGNIMTRENVHDLLKLRFLKIQVNVNESTGEFIERIKSTTELSTSEMMDYIAEIQQFSAEYFGIVIPDPNTDLQMVFND